MACPSYNIQGQKIGTTLVSQMQSTDYSGNRRAEKFNRRWWSCLASNIGRHGYYSWAGWETVSQEHRTGTPGGSWKFSLSVLWQLDQCQRDCLTGARTAVMDTIQSREIWRITLACLLLLPSSPLISQTSRNPESKGLRKYVGNRAEKERLIDLRANK